MHDVTHGSELSVRLGSVALQQSLRSWDGLVECLPVAIYVCDSDGVIVQYNRQAEQLWGRTPAPGDSEERFCGSHRLYLIDGQPLPHARCPMADVLRSGEAVRNRQVIIERPDGSRVSAMVNIAPLFDDGGRVVGAVNCFQDVTELHQANAELKRRQQELEDFFENSAVALHIVDGSGTILRANKSELDLLGYDREEYVGRNIRDFHVEGDASDDILERLLRGEKLERYPARLRAKDGSTRNVLITSNAQFHDNEFVHTRCFTVDVTDQVRAQEALREQDRRLAVTYEYATVAIAEVDAEGRLLRVNETACQITGYSREEMIGSNIFDNDDPACGDADRSRFFRLVAGEMDRYSVEKRFIRKDGTGIWIAATCSAVRDSDGRFLYAVRVFDDITQSKQIADALAESEQRLAATYEQATIGISEADAEGRLLRVNEASCMITGYSREHLLKRGPFFEQMLPEEAEKERVLYRKQIAGEIERYSIEKQIRRRDGSLIWVVVMSSSVRDRDGKFRYAVRVIQDITERKLAEERLRASERRLRELLEGLPAAIYTTDAHGRITFFNQAAVEFSGRQPTLGSDEWCVSWRLYRPDGTPMPHDECPMAIALREQRPIRDTEAVAERPDGTRVPFIPYPTPLFDENGVLTGAINMLVDITDRKRAEGRLKTLIDELNHRVKNTLATVQSLARQTARGATTVRMLEERLEGRLIALSQAHDQLTRGNWQQADLREILMASLSPYHDEVGKQLFIDGAPVKLKPRAALTLAMVFHELITNAAKYGALSRESGRLEVDWVTEPRADGTYVRLSWRESGGPEVKMPERGGFGTKMVERSVPAELGGLATLRFDPEGVKCELEFPLVEIGEPELAKPKRRTRTRRRG